MMEGYVTAYSPEMDMTFILEDDEQHTKVVGWYWGKPFGPNTKEYVGRLEAV